MPFTFSHPAAVIPFNEKAHKYFDMTALILGSMAPDFEYFINFQPKGTLGHTFLGFILYNLPICFLLAVIFHKIVKKPLIKAMPSPIDKWFNYIANKTWTLNSVAKFIIFIYSALFGMVTHIIWDSFTHENGYFVKLIPSLSKSIDIHSLNMPIYKFLQHGSTLVGAIIILIFLLKLRDKNSKLRKRMNSEYKLIFFIFIAASSIMFTIFSIISTGVMDIKYIGMYIVTSINGGIFGTIFISVIYSLKIC